MAHITELADYLASLPFMIKYSYLMQELLMVLVV